MHWLARTGRIWLSAFVMRAEHREVRTRARAVMGSLVVAMALVTALATLLAVGTADSFVSSTATQRERHGLDVLAALAPQLPRLDRAALRDGLSPASTARLDAVVRRGDALHLLAGLRITDARGRAVYSSYRRGVSRTGGTLTAVEPIRDFAGRTYGSLELALPLGPILSSSARARRDILIFVVGGSLLLWLLALPFTATASVGIARSWLPGRRRILSDFQRGLDRQEVELVYQPQVDPASGRVQALEALVRWSRDGRTRSPAEFLPIVERSHLMAELTDRVIELATEELARLRDAGHRLRISINLSAKDLEDEAVATRIAEALKRRNLECRLLTVEVTETSILHDIHDAQRVLCAISDLGVEVAVDDFGTGHASISRLHQFPIREVKVDRSFVTPSDPRTRNYLTAIVRFGQSLGLRVVAEGIEDQPTIAYLRELGCDLVQGYQIAKPLAADQVHDWLTRNTARQMIGSQPEQLVA